MSLVCKSSLSQSARVHFPAPAHNVLLSITLAHINDGNPPTGSSLQLYQLNFLVSRVDFLTLDMHENLLRLCLLIAHDDI